MPLTMEAVPTAVAMKTEELSAPVGKDTSYRLIKNPAWMLMSVAQSRLAVLTIALTIPGAIHAVVGAALL